jgi:hypothetical protein
MIMNGVKTAQSKGRGHRYRARNNDAKPESAGASAAVQRAI